MLAALRGRSTVTSTIIASRGIRRVVHCHADHWEPDAVARQLGSAADVELWLARQHPAVPTLFVSPPIGYTADLRLRMTSTAAIQADYLRRLVDRGVGVGLHVHHEAWTRNTRTRWGSPSQVEVHARVMAESDAAADHARLREYVEAGLDWLRMATGLTLAEWHFVHGCWALGASDPEICTLTDELPLLYSLGCRADFSFPAGRRHCDPPWDRPKWVLPASGERAAERGDPRDTYGDGRMLVWASRTDGWWCGLDTYSQYARRLNADKDKIERYLRICPVIDGVAYIKTCSHAMHPHYWQDGDPRPTLGMFARQLERAVGDVEFVTTGALAL